MKNENDVAVTDQNEDTLGTDRVSQPHENAADTQLDTWINSMPQEVQPSESRRHFPTVLMRLQTQWNDPLPLHELFDEIIIDGRGDRLGFPIDVMAEIHNLRTYYFETLHPESRELFEPQHGLNPIQLSRK